VVSRRDQIWGWALVLLGMLRLISAADDALNHFTLLSLASIALGVVLVLLGFRRLTPKRSS
jgi:hypothetical protein